MNGESNVLMSLRLDEQGMQRRQSNMINLPSAASYRTPRKRTRWAANVGPSSDADVSSDDEEEETHGMPASSSKSTIQIQSPPPTKRRHLGGEDVGRFANMTIGQDINRPQAIVVPPTSSLSQDGSITVSEYTAPSCASAEIHASSVEEPWHDVDMHARRGPHTIQVDKDRFYITSLSDSSSEEGEAAMKQEQKEIDDILAGRRTVQDDAEISRATSDVDNDQNSPAFLINGKLLTKLQVLDWQRRRGLASSAALTPIASPQTPAGEKDSQSALILWRKPDDIRTSFAPAELPTCQQPPLVHEDGAFAFVQRPSNDGMDIDRS